MNEYLGFLQIAAVTAVACVLMVSLSGEMYSLEKTTEEVGSGKEQYGTKYLGKRADAARFLLKSLAIFIALSYTTLLGAIVLSTTNLISPVPPFVLSDYFAVVVSVTIVIACWLAGLSCWIRSDYMKKGMTR